MSLPERELLEDLLARVRAMRREKAALAADLARLGIVVPARQWKASFDQAELELAAQLRRLTDSDRSP